MAYRAPDEEAVRDREATAAQAAAEEADLRRDMAAPIPLLHQLWSRNPRAPGCLVALLFVLPGMGIGCVGGKWFYDADILSQTRGDFAGALTCAIDVLVGGAMGLVLGLIAYARLRGSRRSNPLQARIVVRSADAPSRPGGYAKIASHTERGHGVMANSKTFRPDDGGARHRLVHWMSAAAALLLFVFAGLPGLWHPYFVGMLLLHARIDRVRGPSLMGYLLERRARARALEWRAFLGATHRRTMSLAGRRPHRFVATVCFIALFALTVVLGARVTDASTPLALASRLGIALAVSAAMWVALFGLSRRARLVFGIDGVRVNETFLAYSTVSGFTRKPDGVLIEQSSPLRSIFVPTSDPETAEHLVALLSSERARALRRRDEPSAPLPAAGFRESAPQVGWRVRLLDAASAEERDALIMRVSLEELRGVLDETADPSLEEALHAHLRKGP